MVELIKTAVKIAITMMTLELFGHYFLRDLFTLRRMYDIRAETSDYNYITVLCALGKMPSHIFSTFPFKLVNAIVSLVGVVLKLILKLILSIVDAILGIIWNMIPIIRRFKQPRLSKLIKM